MGLHTAQLPGRGRWMGFDEKRKKDIAAITVNGGCDDDSDGGGDV